MTTSLPSGERHIASFVVYVQPTELTSLLAELAQWPGCDVHQRHASGKFVLVCECASDDALNQLMTQLHHQSGVVNVALVSHFVEDDAALSAPHLATTVDSPSALEMTR